MKRQNNRLSVHLLGLIIVAAALLQLASPPAGAVERKALFLYDGSRSMYPGYDPNAPPSKTDSPLFYHQQPEFLAILSSITAHQKDLGCDQMSFKVFISKKSGAVSANQYLNLGSGPPSSLPVSSPVFFAPLDQAWKEDKKGMGHRTLLEESLRESARGFEGLIWLVTDNIVDTRSTMAADRKDVLRFFQYIMSTPSFLSVHIYKLPYHGSNLAVYALLTSERHLSEQEIADYDARLKDYTVWFPSNEHLKLKDVRIQPLSIEALTPTLEVGANATSLGVSLSVKSNLTHHIVNSAKYVVQVERIKRTSPEANFAPETIPLEMFGSFQGETGKLPPGEKKDFHIDLPLLGKHLAEEMPRAARNAWQESGKPLEYALDVAAVFSDIAVTIEEQKINGIWGIENAKAVFGLPDSGQWHMPGGRDDKKMSLVFSPPPKGWWKTAAKGILPLLALALVGAGIFALRSQESYRVTVGGQTSVIPLRRFASQGISRGQAPVGVLSRGLGKDFLFRPVLRLDQEAKRVEGAKIPTYIVTVSGPGGPPEQVTVAIEALGGGRDAGGRGGKPSGAPPRGHGGPPAPPARPGSIKPAKRPGVK